MIRNLKNHVTNIWNASPVIPVTKRTQISEQLQNKPYIKLDDLWINDMIPKTITRLSKDELIDSSIEHQKESSNMNGDKREMFAGLRPRNPPSLIEKKRRLRQLRPTQFACEIEKTIYTILQEGKLPNAYAILSNCRIDQVLVDKGIRTCTIIWNIDTNDSSLKNIMIDKLDATRHVLRYELGQRLRFRSVPDIIFTGK